MKRLLNLLPERIREAIKRRNAKQRAVQQEIRKKIVDYDAFMKAVETLMRKQGLDRLEAIRVLNEKQMELRRIEAGGPPVPEEIFPAEAAFEDVRGARASGKKKKKRGNIRKAVPQE